VSRILIADDNRDCADSLALLLEHRGHETSTVYGGQQAVDEAQRFGPDVVILDIDMPGLDGYQAARILRTANATRPLLVAFTAVAGAGQKRRARDVGFDYHFVKPADLMAMLDLVGPDKEGLGH
jgi:CheY-like chemotaxis protein